MGRKRRLISKAKTYGFHPWFDQVDAIDQIVKDTGLSESIVLRKLIDEALVARRRKTADEEVLGPSAEQRSVERHGSPQDLLLKIVKQNSASLRMQDITLALVQEALAEARAGRNLDWEQVTPSLQEQGLSNKQIAERFEQGTEAAKEFAYGIAQDVKNQQEQ